jgi:hypothetical protein
VAAIDAVIFLDVDLFSPSVWELVDDVGTAHRDDASWMNIVIQPRELVQRS